MRYLISLLLCLCLMSTAVQAQNFYVPYRVGNKFGLADNRQKMIIPPAFDIVRPLDHTGLHFVAYKLFKDSFSSALMVNGKALLQDQHYKYYSIEGAFITASVHFHRGRYDMGSPIVDERYALFYKNGERVFRDDLSYVNVLTHNIPKDMNDVLVSITDTQKRSSLFIFDKHAPKNKKAIYTDATLLDTDHEEMYATRQLVHWYRKNDGKVFKVVISFADKNIRIISNEGSDPPQQADYDNYGYGGPGAPPRGEDGERLQRTKEESIAHVNTVSTKIYDRPVVDKIYSFKKEIENSILKVVVNSDKQGLMHPRKDSLVVPAVYDEIIQLSDYRGFALKQQNKFGLYYNDTIIAPIFGHIAIPSFKDYGEKDNILLQLFDEKNMFLCYANSSGEVFYNDQGK